MLAELKDIYKSYETNSRLQGEDRQRSLVLDGLSLQIPVAGSIAIVGPSGSGKSTLLNILGTLDRPTSGAVILNGKNISDLAEDELPTIRNSFIGFVFQLHHLLPQLTLLENVLLPVLPQNNKLVMKQATERAIGLLERVGLKEHLTRHPYQLSVGECQRTALVRALINRPKLLLADEPTGSLDANNATLLGELMSSLGKEQESAVVVVTHASELAARMDETYRLTGGKLNRIP